MQMDAHAKNINNKKIFRLFNEERLKQNIFCYIKKDCCEVLNENYAVKNVDSNYFSIQKMFEVEFENYFSTQNATYLNEAVMVAYKMLDMQKVKIAKQKMAQLALTDDKLSAQMTNLAAGYALDTEEYELAKRLLHSAKEKFRDEGSYLDARECIYMIKRIQHKAIDKR